MTTNISNKFKPQYIPFRCPNCRGRGRVNWDKEICKSCGGIGIIKVPSEEVVEGSKNAGNY